MPGPAPNRRGGGVAGGKSGGPVKRATIAGQLGLPRGGGGAAGRQPPDLNHVHRGIWLGGRTSVRPHILKSLGIKYVVNTARELKWRNVIDWEELRQQGIIVMQIQWGDDYEQKIFPSREMNAAIQWIDKILAGGEQVLIHCSMGKSRSTSLVTSYLIVREGMTYDQALALIRSKRPIANPNGNFEEQLRNVEDSARMAKSGQQPQQRRASYHAAPVTHHGHPARGGVRPGGGYMAAHPRTPQYPTTAVGQPYAPRWQEWDDDDDDDDFDI